MKYSSEIHEFTRRMLNCHAGPDYETNSEFSVKNESNKINDGSLNKKNGRDAVIQSIKKHSGY